MRSLLLHVVGAIPLTDWVRLSCSTLCVLLCLQHITTLPEALHIYMCWPRNWLDAAYVVYHAEAQQARENSKDHAETGRRARLAKALYARRAQATTAQASYSPQQQLTTKAALHYLHEVGDCLQLLAWAMDCRLIDLLGLICYMY